MNMARLTDKLVRITGESYNKLLQIKKNTRVPIKYIIESLLSDKIEQKKNVNS